MRTFVICRMYAGSYITSKMGGEIINLLHDDNGNNYVYVNPYGYIDKKYTQCLAQTLQNAGENTIYLHKRAQETQGTNIGACKWLMEHCFP